MVSNTSCFFSHHMEPRTTMAFYGFTPPADVDQSFDHAIGGSAVQRVTSIYPEPNIGDLWFTSTLAGDDSIEQIDIGPNGPLLVFDYAIATVAELEELRGQTILVDDSNSEIQWVGAWQERRNYTLFSGVTLPRGDSRNPVPTRPHGNGTHESDSVGASMVFQFQGSSILVAGIAPINRTVESFAPGPVLSPPVSDFLLELNVTLDGTSHSVVFTNGGLSQPGGSPHFPYFRNDSLEEGNHTLIMTVKNVTGNTSVVVDYITYKPSFATLQNKPNFPPINLDNNTTSAPSPTSTPPPNPGDKSNNVGAIAGGVVGGVAFLVLLVLGFWLLRRKREKQIRHLHKHDSMNVPSNTREVSNSGLSSLAVEPFILPIPTETSSRKGAQSVSLQSPLTTALSSKGQWQRTRAEPSVSPTVSSPDEQHAELR
ncbi:hypothetical protein VKT23_008943 [Stygiomarasmius scandens]|uniref:Uncharacterized protein n=1 Tax=Marasmiellus scandens TaxID=2682957 RepID=A0ABR1JH40_9AGAR